MKLTMGLYLMLIYDQTAVSGMKKILLMFKGTLEVVLDEVV